MKKTDIYFRHFVQEIVETFDLTPVDDAMTKLMRTTNVTLRGRLQFVKHLLLLVGLKKVHRFVFRNWKRLCSDSAS